MKKYKNTIIAIVVLFISAIIFATLYFKYQLTAVSPNNTSENKIITIEPGSIWNTAKTLKEYNLIRNSFCFLLYVKLTGTNLQASTYELNETMSTQEIASIMNSGGNYTPDTIMITFQEGINIRKFAQLVAEHTINEENEVYEILEDENYIDSLIEKYWFLTDKIKDSNIYYPLEGYLFPDTYNFIGTNVTIQKIIETLLDETAKKLEPYKETIENSNLDIHELITLASLVELEAADEESRKGVAGVFYNRLNTKMSLGSDVTTYYAEKIDNWSRSLTTQELNNCSNAYNTRCSTKIGLPVGPICNPSLESIIATLEPTKHNYYYFVADCSKKTYFSKTNSENLQTKQKLINQNNWCG